MPESVAAQQGVAAERRDRGDFVMQMQQKAFPDLSVWFIPAVR